MVAQGSPAKPSLPCPTLRQVADAVRAAGGLIVSTHFTLVPGKDGNPLMSSHLKNCGRSWARGFRPRQFWSGAH
ncbi:MAG: hypothetical protein CM1200mP18_19400 [Gammaproteobacteria bacterium]|nr:MAG: hypothetical protein CM1200mP18_19400 [Gammaproteobacteria bacterium]